MTAPKKKRVVRKVSDPLKEPLLPGLLPKPGRPKKFVRKVPSEALECQRLIDYLRARNIRFAHVPNEATSRTQRIKNARMGASAGVPDYLILLPSITLWIEMKKQKGGRVSAEQAAWCDALNKQPGQLAVVCHGFEQAKAVVEANL